MSKVMPLRKLQVQGKTTIKTKTEADQQFFASNEGKDPECHLSILLEMRLFNATLTYRSSSQTQPKISDAHLTLSHRKAVQTSSPWSPWTG